MSDLSSLIKAYDVRGIVPDDWDEDVSRAIGAAFAEFVLTESGATAVVTAHDMRESSIPLSRAFAEGVLSRGVDVVEAGLGSTDLLYFAAGSLDLPGAMFTASHNPAEYNGIKLCRAGAAPIGQDSGLLPIREWAERDRYDREPDRIGSVSSRDVLAAYAAYLHSLVDLSTVRPLKVVVDAGNGMGGHTVPTVLAGLPLTVVPMYFELDGTFPNHEANPLEPKNLVDLQRAVVEHGADLGLAFDGDADRCFVVDERGSAVTPSAVAAIVALREIARARAEDPDAEITVIHNLITSNIVPETIEAAGAVPLRTRVGHTLIKDAMRRSGAVFGGEHSAHYYFRDFWSADNGMLAAMHLLAEFGAQDRPLSELSARYTPYAMSGEINSTVADVPAAFTRIVEAFTPRADFDELDGLTVTGRVGQDEPFWWFSVRPSNTEPLLRLNVEAGDQATMARIRDEVLALIRA